MGLVIVGEESGEREFDWSRPIEGLWEEFAADGGSQGRALLEAAVQELRESRRCWTIPPSSPDGSSMRRNMPGIR